MQYTSLEINRKSMLFIGAIFWILINCILRGANEIYYKGDTVLYVTCVVTLIMFLFILYNLVKWKGTIFKIVTLFIIMYFLFLQGQMLLNVFGMTTAGVMSEKFSSSQVVDGILDVHLYMAMFMIGVVTTKIKKKKVINDVDENEELSNRLLVKVGYIVMLCAAPFEIIVSFAKMSFSLTQGYASLYQEASLNAIPSGFKILSYFFMTGCFFILFGSKRGSFSEKVSFILIGVNAVVKIIIGYRNSAVVPILMLLYCLSIKSEYIKDFWKKKKIKRIIRRVGIIGIFVILIVFPVVRETRNTGGLSLDSIFAAFSIENYKELFTTVNDMGKSLQTVIYTRELVPSSYPFRYGYSYIMNFTTVLPNLFWDRHPAEVYGSLGKWLTKIVDNSFWAYGGSLGFSCVAEAYINFGYLGIISIGFLTGRIMEYFEEKVDYSRKAIDYASFASVAIYLMAYSRGEFGDLVRGIFWYMLLPRAFYFFLKNRKNRKGEHKL